MTIAGLYAFLVETAGGYLAKAGKSTDLDVVTGRCPALDGPIDRAIRRAGVVPADDSAPTDLDLAAVQPGAAPYVQALAAAETFAAVAGWLAKVDQAIGPSNQKLSQYAAQAMTLAKWWEERASSLAPMGVASTAAACGAASGMMAPTPERGGGGFVPHWGWSPPGWGGHIP